MLYKAGASGAHVSAALVLVSTLKPKYWPPVVNRTACAATFDLWAVSVSAAHLSRGRSWVGPRRRACAVTTRLLVETGPGFILAQTGPSGTGPAFAINGLRDKSHWSPAQALFAPDGALVQVEGWTRARSAPVVNM